MDNHDIDEEEVENNKVLSVGIFDLFSNLLVVFSHFLLRSLTFLFVMLSLVNFLLYYKDRPCWSTNSLLS